MSPDPQAYRQLSDQGAKAAEYRVYWILGKAFLLLGAFASGLLIAGLNHAHGFSLWWLFLLPAGLMAGLVWKGFPAFCRCPECRRRMVSRSKDGRVIRSGKFFREVGPMRHYLVCDHCRLYLFLGESRDC